MATQTLVFASFGPAAGPVKFSLTYDDVTGAVLTVSGQNQSDRKAKTTLNDGTQLSWDILPLPGLNTSISVAPGVSLVKITHPKNPAISGWGFPSAWSFLAQWPVP